jgi:hypothetical protein
MSSADLLVSPTTLTTRTRRFALAWRDRQRRVIAPVGVLDHLPHGYRFQYLANVDATVSGLRPFVGFPDFTRVYTSNRLWPFFDLRVMDRKRPDFPEYVHWLGLSESASTLDILSRSGGEQKGDSVYLAEEPQVANDGVTEAVFLARGVRYALREHNTENVACSLRAGDSLVLVDDHTNEVNPAALLLATPEGAAIGWIPDLLIDYARQVRAGGGVVELLQNNLPAPWHARLLIRISGRVAPGTAVFTGGVWPSLD